MFILCETIPLTMFISHTLKSVKVSVHPILQQCGTSSFVSHMQQFLKISQLEQTKLWRPFWGKIFETFVCLSATEASIGTFYKQNSKSMRDCSVCTIQLAMNVFNKHFCNVKNRKISGIGGEEDIYNIAFFQKIFI